MPTLRVHFLQTDLQWEDFPANCAHIETQISDLEGKTDILLLPEMFGSGFTMQPAKVAQEMDGPGVNWMIAQARRLGAAVIGSLVIREEDNYFNRLICAEEDGSVSFYDKRHLFTFAGEQKEFTAGHHHLILTIKGWKILALICYDLRFPVWSRNVWNYDLLVYVANWPSPRIEAWTTLLRARAIENLAYTIGVNRVGSDPAGNAYTGQSVCFDMAGKMLLGAGDGEELCGVTLERAPLTDFRSKFSFLKDMDRFQIN